MTPTQPTRPSTHRRTAALLAAAAALALVAGCAAPTSPRARTEVVTGSTPVEATAAEPNGDTAVDIAPAPIDIATIGGSNSPTEPLILDASVPIGSDTACAGIDHATADPVRVDADTGVAEMFVCAAGWGYLPGDGIWTVIGEYRVPGADQDALIAALARPDVVPGPDTACAAVYIPTPTVTVVTSDGRRLKAAVPSNGCHPQQESLDRTGAVVSGRTSERLWRIVRQQTEAELTTSCPPEQEKIDDASGADLPKQPATTVAPSVPPEGAEQGAAVCLYGPSEPSEDPAGSAVPQANPSRDPATEPATTEPATTEPATTEPATTDPAAADPAVAEPAVAASAVAEPAVPETATAPGAGGGVGVAPRPGSMPVRTVRLLGSGTIDVGLRDRLIASVSSTPPAGCSPSDPWTGSDDGATHLVLAGPVTRSAAGVPQPGYAYLAVETGPCARMLDNGFQLVGWADPAVVREVRTAAHT